MSFSKIAALSGLVAFASAHGTVTGIVADGIYYEGYSASFQYLQTAPKVVGWSIPEDLSNGFIAPDAYATSDIICHLGATNAQASAPVSAGGIVELQWTAWPSSHHGPVIDYLANCNGDCSTVDKTTLEWFKIDAGGLYDDTTLPGNWASDTLIANNNSWSVTIPSDIASGNYVLRHEIIALHSAEESDGAQNYPQCVNLEITGTGTATPSGTLGTALYSETDAGILVNIYQSLSTYEIPGPTLYSGAVSMSETQQPAATAVASGIIGSGSAVVASTTAAASSVATSAVASSAAGVTAASSATSSAVSASVTSAPQIAVSSPVAPYSNSTATSSKKSKSACKNKSSKTSPAAVFSTSSAINVGAVNTESILTTSAASVTIATTLPASTEAATTSAAEAATTTAEAATTTAASTSATATSSGDATLPEGTTLNTLLSWISSFYNKFKGTTYDADTTVARRHARDLAARQFDQFSGLGSQATGTGFAHPSGGFAHHTGGHGGFGGAKPTGTASFGKNFRGFAKASGGFAAPSGAAHPTHHHHHPHGTGSAGVAKPTGF
ncbi:related to endoglucanase IV precursor [Phialocephala subalpina]|uniref:Related to endoglucanase IV n=1 Tax=Phialocephala subalpina TaxID=576137 RepID=A0A1L7XNW7_9HELO|nr:related to endoglucanase IV precursor [Phialocephala subalpina]